MIVDTEVTELAPHSTRAWKKEVGVVTPGSWEEHKGTCGTQAPVRGSVKSNEIFVPNSGPTN